MLCQALNVTSDALLGLDKPAMERTLNQMEQHIISAFRSMDKETQSHVFCMFSLFSRLCSDLAEKTDALECAEQFIKDTGLQGEWEETKQERASCDESK